MATFPRRFRSPAFAKFAELAGAPPEEEPTAPAPTEGGEAGPELPVQILVALLAMRQQYHSAHWQAAGPSFKADHDLFAQLYATVSGEIDPLAEKITCIYGAELVNPVSLSGQQATTSAQFAAGGDAFASAMSAEDQLQGLIKQAVSTPGSVSIGLDNYLRGVADAHETHKYLLKQRMAGA